MGKDLKEYVQSDMVFRADVVVKLAEELQKRDKNILATLGVREEIKVYRKNIFDEYKYCEIDDF